MRLRRYCISVAIIASVALALPVRAQDGFDAKLERDFEAAFEKVLNDPANLDTSFSHAELAIRIGDFEAAISSLERMLIYNPALPRVRLELGVLYFRLGSYAIASNYLTGAVRGADVPADVKARVEKYLGEIEKRTSRHNFSGSIFSGLRYQSNVNAAPERPAGYAFGVLQSVTTRNDDKNVFASGSLRYIYDPQSANGNVLESTLLGYVSRQLEEHDYNLVYMEGTLGPRGRFMPETFDLVSLHPYVSFSYVALANSRYYHAFGSGFEFEKKFSPATTGRLKLEFQTRAYRNDVGRASARDNSGEYGEVSANVRHQVNSWLLIGGKLGLETTAAAISENSNREITIGANAIVTYDAPIKFGDETWSTSFDTTVSDADYKAIDSDVISSRKRREREVRFTTTTTIPIDRRWALSTTLERTRVSSNILNYDYTNSSVTIGASLRF